jgi:predicted NBD/HSP70 family sugar kinase
MLSNNLSNLKSSILTLLRQEPLTIASLNDATNVSLPTLRRAVEELIDAHWVRPVGRIPRTGGRPATLYGLDDRSYLILGVHLELPGLHFALTNLAGEIINHQHLLGETDIRPNGVVRLIVDHVNRLKTQYAERQLLGLGIATPGYVDPSSGAILSIGRAPQWQAFPLKARLEADVGLPVIVENDIDCMTFAEIGDGGFNDIEDMIYLGFTEGVKASFLLQGQLYKGPFGNAGLIGHTTVVEDGRLCTCGKYGCLETVASVRAINSLFDKGIESGNWHDSDLQRIHALKDRIEKFQAILVAAEAGDPFCSEIIEDMLRGLELAIVNLIYLLQVDQLVIGGALSNLPDGLLARLETELRDKLSPILSHHLIIRRARRTEPHIAAVGATYRFFYSCISREECLALYEL